MDVLVRLQGWSSEGAFSIFSLVLYPVLAGGFFLAKLAFLPVGKVRDATEEMTSMVEDITSEELITASED